MQLSIITMSNFLIFAKRSTTFSGYSKSQLPVLGLSEEVEHCLVASVDICLVNECYH